MWPVAFLLCSMAAALAAKTRMPEDDGSEGSHVTIFYLSRGGRAGSGGGNGGSSSSSGRRRRGVGRGNSRAEEIEDLAFPREKKEWIYPAQ